MTGLIYSLEGSHFGAFTRKPIADEQSESAKRSSPRRLYAEGRLCVQRCGKFFAIRQEEPKKDIRGIGHKLGHITFREMGKTYVRSRTNTSSKPRKRDEKT